MSAEPASSVAEAPPDRLLAAACGRVLAASLLIVLLGQGLAIAVAERNARMAGLVALAGEQSARAQDMLDHLARFDSLADGPERRTAQTVIGYEADALVAAERAHAALLGRTRWVPGASLRPDVDGMLRGLQSMVGSDGAMGPVEADRLRSALVTTVVPALDQGMRLTRRQADAVSRQGRILFWTGALGQILAFIAVSVGLLRPAVARTRAWMQAATEAEDKARNRLLHDPLTQLPNATYLNGFLARLVAEVGRHDVEAAIIRLELERFAALRDALGQGAAAEILRLAAKRLQQCLRSGDFAAHLGQDSFAIVATDLSDANAVAVIAQRLQASLSRPYAVGNGTRRIGCRIGVAVLSDDRPERLLANAEIALSQTRQGAPGIRYFNEQMRAEVEERAMLCAEIIQGIDQGAFVPHFQPQLKLANGEFLGFEALARWNHPERGVLSPRDFLEVAEQADLIEALGEAILIGVLDAITRWDAAGLHVPCVGVNFALAQLHAPGLIERIKWEVDRRDIDPCRLSIEVLETVLIKSDADLVVRNLRGLAAAGFRIDLDDFGTGHASISNLRRFMATRIKIDRSFVRNVDTSDEQHKVVASIIAMARALDIRTLAEGVETAGEEAALRAIGCDEVQGYRIARPMDEAAASAWLRARGEPSAAEPKGGLISP
jgi:diguanylate cyclase (GGDEF)-like protein